MATAMVLIDSFWLLASSLMAGARAPFFFRASLRGPEGPLFHDAAGVWWSGLLSG